ncbi:DUF373 family protein [Methanococcoides burtonii]|uniref:DUF373 family protein n=1 Tax=Methanococcoides burtonii (strain DSM 6242 / NBRC 107633 / OCM 468 / ACE-M) TaxID=259564 RepID=Q12ZD3_METBU|nr:DUF373 family protein [Methanococcoides burtonii]ABE51193.1 Protein of unknown function DUF373 [Methanococcoides burtonii DSM 6242]
MRTLVICIDRDNDLGEKANVSSPIIGREDNIKAAVELATVDPEDSDSNTIFGGVNVLNELHSKGIDAEIVTFAGDKNVGIISDQKIVVQLDAFLEENDITNAIFISDGAEDETLLPIVQSRIKIDSVKRIVVQQSANLESTYYILKNAFNDPKISQTFFVPIGLTALIYAIFLLANYPEGAIIGISAAIGAYMLYRGFNLDQPFALLRERMKGSFYEGQMTFVTNTIAIILAVIATMIGAITLWKYFTTGGGWYYGLITLFTVFINVTVWWYVIAILFANIGKMVDLKRNDHFSLKDVSPSLFITAMGLLFWGASTYILTIGAFPGATDSPNFSIQYFIYSVVGAIIIALAGIKISQNESIYDTKRKITKGKKDKNKN